MPYAFTEAARVIDPQGLAAMFETLAQNTLGDAAEAVQGSGMQSQDQIGAPNGQLGSSLLDAAALTQQSAAGTPGGVVMPAAMLANLGGDADISSAFAAILGNLENANGANASTTEAALAKLLADVRAPALLADPQTVKALALLVSGGAQLPGANMPGGEALARLVTLLRAASGGAPGSAGTSARASLAAFVDVNPDEVRNAAVLARAGVDGGMPLAGGTVTNAPPPEASKKTAAAARRELESDENAARDAVLPIPERDYRGAPYDAAARARLARLGRDPRSGFAPEATAAYEAERETGLALERANEPGIDYVDADGGRWIVVTPREAFGLEGLVRALAARANAVVTFKSLAPDQLAPAIAVAARLADTPGIGRLLVVEQEQS